MANDIRVIEISICVESDSGLCMKEMQDTTVEAIKKLPWVLISKHFPTAQVKAIEFPDLEPKGDK